ncbi:GNAT family N-acetyltransferase [Vagococcus bubulae]|uniref:N-acetyltransferase domain-containing protein n=1 Tax=Vagococcus bubulae TaxID=1977868 RepID=A0A429ZK35_9ENTE|nr:GNAT family N-acetyltransferase [Vagococcus bubulae]RST94058.1 hypothetical protein CBF36_06675 [Vagococcus bubulae]
MIRKINLTDANAICQINTEDLGYAFPIEQTKHQIERIINDTEHYYLIGYEDSSTKKIVGYLHAEVYRTTYFETLLNVLGLAVLGDYQRQGIGKQLMLELEHEAKLRNITAIRLNSGEERKEAHLFYESLGYISKKNQKQFMKNIE